jgi:hypothetical protein
LGTALGLIAGAVGGIADDAVMRLVDVLLSIPGLLLSLSIIILLGFGTVNAAIAVGITSVANFARLARAEVVRVRHSDYVEAAYGSGGTFWAVLWRHILPKLVNLGNCLLGIAVRQRDSGDCHLELPGLRHATADARVGAADRRRAQLYFHRLVANHLPVARRYILHGIAIYFA